ncbi:MAG TPA: phage holin family protein [Thermomicrobiales bacterium]|nr:phage holin family protein [Thermomicrobiales bacterium]
MSESADQIQQNIDRRRDDIAEKLDQIEDQVEERVQQVSGTVNQDMLRSELDRAKGEVKAEVARAGMGAAAIGGGGVVGLVAVVFLVQALMELLARRLPRWQAAGLVGLALSGTAIALGLSGKHQLQPDNLAPRQTITSLRQTAARAKAQLTSRR